jgi:PST family polysaccharide transporter
MQFLCTHYEAKKIHIVTPIQTWRETLSCSGSIISLGFSLMWSALAATLVAYSAVYLINHFENVEAVGIYSAALMLSGTAVSFILTAMSAEYYPRLAGISGEKAGIKILVNEQTELGLLLALPCLLACIFFAPWLVNVFFSKEFAPATPLIKWFILGCLCRVISFPMGYVLMATRQHYWLFVTETLFSVLHVLLIILGLWWFGIVGVAIAFFLLYFCHVLAMYGLMSYLIGFTWSPSTFGLVGISLGVLLTASLITEIFIDKFVVVAAILIMLFSTIFCLRAIVSRIGTEGRVIKGLLEYRILKIILTFKSR